MERAEAVGARVLAGELEGGGTRSLADHSPVTRRSLVRGFLNQLDLSGQILNKKKNFFSTDIWRAVSVVFSTPFEKTA